MPPITSTFGKACLSFAMPASVVLVCQTYTFCSEVRLARLAKPASVMPVP